jgi:hypothetical protein
VSHGFRAGDKVVTLTAIQRSPWPEPGKENTVAEGTLATVLDRANVASDVVWISIDAETAVDPDPFGDNAIAVNVKKIRKVADSTQSTRPEPTD